MQTSPTPITARRNNAVDAGSITAHAHYLIMKAQLAGNFRFDGHCASSEEVAIAEQCRSLAGSIGRDLPACSDEDIPELLECYDIIYRIAYNRMPDADFMRRQRHRCISSWQAGNRRIDESKVFGIIASEVMCRHDKAEIEHMKARVAILDRWVATLARHNYFPDVTASENYRRLAIIMHENLDRYFTGRSRQMKRIWYDHNKIDDLTIVGSTILRSYRRFAVSLFPDVIDFDRKMELDCKILEELSDRQDLHPYDRAAFGMALEYNRTMTFG